MLAQRAASEGPRWTRALETTQATLAREDRNVGKQVRDSMHAVKGSLGHSLNEAYTESEGVQWGTRQVTPLREVRHRGRKECEDAIGAEWLDVP